MPEGCSGWKPHTPHIPAQLNHTITTVTTAATAAPTDIGVMDPATPLQVAAALPRPVPSPIIHRQ